ncbi:hypothetical protein CAUPRSCDRAFT_11270 [Caulochytrium protostelioides]|uniref:Uncharacterized protein n=1 Tax=Caulochytrium protostelioides TaxID=1555241 RepID=A0A4P9WZL7_9FUNG|nr:hypothetical protein CAUPRSCDRAFT_11270 [Caulochytrium protostelioides]
MAGRLGPAADARHDGLLTATSAVSAAPMAGPMPVTPIPPSLAPTPSMAPTPGLASSAPSGPPAPMLEIRPSRFVFDGVYLNGLSSLRKFEIANISPFPLTVKLRSNLGRQVGFQLRNENLPDTPRRPSMLSPPPPAQPPPPPPPPLLAAADPATTAGVATVAAAATELVRRSMPLSMAVATATTSTAPSEIGESLTSSLESLLLTHMGGPSASAAAAAAATVASAIESKAGTMATVTMPAVAAAAAAAAAALAVASAAQPKLDSAPQQPSGRFLLDPISPEEWAVILPPTNTVAAASRARVHLERRAQREAAAQEIRRGSGNGGSGPSSYDEAAAAHASEEAAALAYGTQFNQLFNHVDLLDTVDLAPGECRTLVLSFLPDPTWRRNANAGNVTTTTTTNTSHPTLSTPSSRAQHHLENATSSSSSATPGVAITAPMGCAETAMDSEHDRSAGHDPRGRPPPALTAPPSTAVVAGTSVSTTQREAMMDPERKLDERIAEGDGQDPSDLHADFTDINGLLFFFAYCRRPPITTSPSAASLPTITAADSANEARSLVVSSPPNGPSASRGGTLAGDNTAVMTTAITNAASAAPDFTITAKFRSAVCRSILYSDIVDTGLVFDDCVAGQTYYKDFTLWNRSEIELFWSLELEAVAAPSQAPRRNDLLTILDYDTGEAMVCRSLAAFSPRRIRVMFRPGTATGEYKWELSMENIHDASNTLTAEITATVRTARRQESLIIASGDLIDFGDCVAGIEKTEILLLKNVSHTQLDVRFSSDYPGITFRMVDDELRPGAESGRHHESHDDHLHGRHSAHNVEDDDGSSGGHRHGRGEGSPGTTGGMHPHPSSLMQTGADAANTNSALVGGAYGPTGTAAATADGIGAATAAATTSGQATDDESLTASLSGRDPTNDGYPSEWMRPATSGTATQIEELTLRSHSRRVVQVCYCPLLAEQSGDPKLGRLTKQHARLVLNYNTQSGEPEKKAAARDGNRDFSAQDQSRLP